MKRTFKTAEDLRAFMRSQPAGVWHTVVHHAEWCNPIECQCGPLFVTEPATVENLTEGRRRTLEYVRRRGWAS